MGKHQRRHSPTHERRGHLEAHYPLTNIPKQKSGVVCCLHGDKEFMYRVASLGFTIGARVTVLRNQGQDPVIVSILGAHIALGRQEAGLIQVRLL